MNTTNVNVKESARFAHLHVHTEYSLLDGAIRVKDIAARLKELGQTSVAITDHGNMCGCLPAYKALKKEGLKPIIGCEFYSSPTSRFEKTGSKTSEDKYDHIVLLAKNEKGYKNLCKLCTIGYTEGFYSKPRIDDEVLAQYSEGLVCLSACIAGRIPKLILSGEYAKAKEKALYYKSLFGEDFYIEIQNHGIEEELKATPQLVALAREIGVKIVATNDAHYARREDAEAHDVLLCINTGALVSDENRFKFVNNEFYLKSEEEMRALFPAEYQDAIDNTLEVADKCNFEYDLGHVKLPAYEIPAGFADNKAYFRYLCEKGLKERYGEAPSQEYVDRMNYELGVIEKMGYVDYFLIVLDFINWAKDRDIPVGPGRGSGAGSICAYCTRITNIDPMRFNLFFERFLNPERVSMPDFDIDFCYERRQEVVDYVVQKYGTSKVSQIITYQTLAAKASLKDVARTMGVAYAEANAWSKLVPEEVHMTLDKALESSPELAKIYATNPQAKKVIDIARKIEGMPKSTSKHAAGVLICDKDIVNYAPMLTDEDGKQVIQATMVEVEELGLLKFDFLGLRTLTVISDAIKDIKKNYGIEVDIDNIDDTDAEVFKMLSEGKTRGVFQLESAGMVSTLKGLEPTSIEDLTALISLYRPGPMDSIPQYIQNKNNPEGIVYDDERLKDILGVTYGCLVYQEQVMKLFQILGGFTLGRSDIVRRAISKKKKDVLEAEKRNFIYGVKDEAGNVIACGALANGIPEAVCNKIMDEVTAFASYAFNKSHAACYAVIAYQTAWLKKHYPLEFFAALLTSVSEKADKLKENISSINKEEGIKILAPSVNVSIGGFTADKNENAIRFGLVGLEGVGAAVTNVMIENRNTEGEFTSFYNFVKRMTGTSLNKKAYEALIKAGAFDWTKYNRRTLLENLSDIIAAAAQSTTTTNGQLSLFEYLEDGEKFEEPGLKEYPEWPDDVKLKNERAVARLFLSGHPIAKCRKAINAVNALTPAQAINDFKSGKLTDGAWVTIAGVLFDTNKKLTKAGKPMALFSIQDETAALNGIVFEKCLASADFLFNDGTNIVIKGKIESRDDSIQLVSNAAFGLPTDAQPDEVIENFVKTVGVRRSNNAAPVQQPAQPAYTAPAPQQFVAPQPVQQQVTSARPIISTNENGQKRGLYIKMNDKSELSAYCEIIATIPGSLPVYLWDNTERRMYSNPNFGVSLYNADAIRKMQEMAGPGGVKVIK